MPKVIVSRVVEHKEPYQPEGKTWKKYEIIVDGSIDGATHSKICLKTFKDAIANSVEAGTAFETKADTYKGRTSYVIERQVSSEGVSAPAAGRPAASAGHGALTIEMYDAMFKHAHGLAVSLVGDKDSEALSRLIATWMIGAKDLRMEVPVKAGSAKTEVQAHPNKIDDILMACKLAEIKDWVTDTELKVMFDSCEGKSNRFAKLVRERLDSFVCPPDEKPADETEEDLPL